MLTENNLGYIPTLEKRGNFSTSRDREILPLSFRLYNYFALLLYCCYTFKTPAKFLLVVVIMVNKEPVTTN